MRFHLSLIVYLPFALCLTLPCLSGCGKKEATVKGKVSFMGKPLTTGTVAFVGENDRVGSGPINSDGTYIVKNAPVGETTITVRTPPQPRFRGMGASKPPPGFKMPKEMLPPDYKENKNVPSVPTPEKYSKTESSTLKYTVKPGTQDYDIDLKP